MKERPIIMSTPMVQAILVGRKTQTRRIIKPQPKVYNNGKMIRYSNRKSFIQMDIQNIADPFLGIPCPYGKVGDVLWVKETWIDSSKNGDDEPGACWGYKADYDGYLGDVKYASALFMPKWAARIFLEVTNIKVEKLQDINEADAKAEGIKPNEVRQMWLYGASSERRAEIYKRAAVEPFKSIWQSINGEESWQQNPWVWVISFKRINN